MLLNFIKIINYLILMFVMLFTNVKFLFAKEYNNNNVVGFVDQKRLFHGFYGMGFNFSGITSMNNNNVLFSYNFNAGILLDFYLLLRPFFRVHYESNVKILKNKVELEIKDKNEYSTSFWDFDIGNRFKIFVDFNRDLSYSISIFSIFGIYDDSTKKKSILISERGKYFGAGIEYALAIGQMGVVEFYSALRYRYLIHDKGEIPLGVNNKNHMISLEFGITVVI